MKFTQTLSKRNLDLYQGGLNAKFVAQLNTDESYYISGKSGTGKTTIALEMAKKWIQENEEKFMVRNDLTAPESYVENSIIMMKAYDLVNLARRAEFDAIVAEKWDELKTIPCLIIDDMGIEKVTEFVDQKIYELIDYRYENYGQTIITSNYSIQEVGEKYHDRIASRIISMTKSPENMLTLAGKDKRVK